MEHVWPAVALTGLAGAATMVGGAVGVLGRTPTGRALSWALGLAAGVMLTVSAAEMVPSSLAVLRDVHGRGGAVLVAGAVALGILVYLALAHLLPAPRPADAHREPGTEADRRRFLRLGLITAAAIGLHNLPEGFVTFAGTLQDPRVGLLLAVAMAIHNIPEGVAVAVPVRRATGSRGKAFAWAAVAGAAEPLGALAGYLVLAPVLTPALLAGVTAAVAGVMAALSVHALLPEAAREGGAGAATLGAATGVVVMAASLVMLG